MELFRNPDFYIRKVEEGDADFVYECREFNHKAHFLSPVEDDSVEKQRAWIKTYKKTEQEGKDLYLIFIDKNEEKFGLSRIYDIQNNTAEVGSWVSKPGYKNFRNVLKSIQEAFALFLNYHNVQNLTGTVSKDNHSVQNIILKFGFLKVGEKEDNYLYVLKKENFKRLI